MQSAPGWGPALEALLASWGTRRRLTITPPAAARHASWITAPTSLVIPGAAPAVQALVVFGALYWTR